MRFILCSGNEITKLSIVTFKLFQGASLASGLKTNNDTFSAFHRFPCDRDRVLNLRGDAKVLEEPLMGRPKLSPHGFLHSVLSGYQLCSFVEFLHRFNPLYKQIHSKFINFCIPKIYFQSLLTKKKYLPI